MTSSDPSDPSDLLPGAADHRAAPDDAALVSELVATAFEPLAAVRWLVPEPRLRLTMMAADFRIMVEHALAYGHIDLLADGHAAAVWFDQTVPVPEPPHYDSRLAAATGPYLDRFQVLDTLFEKHHPTVPHHHLAFLAVQPGRQGQGLGSALLRHHHAALDAAGTPAYLEASDPRNRALYLRHGYESRKPFLLPDGTPFWPMWRAVVR